MPQSPDFVRYSPAVETVQPDERETQAELIETFRGIVETTHRDYGHAVRPVHAKGHAILQGTFSVLGGLPAAYAQGLFAHPGDYDAVLRVSTNPGDVLHDSISVPRGMAIKVIGVEGQRLDGSTEAATQDFVMAVGEAFSARDPKAFLKNLKLLAATTDRFELGKKVISAVFRATEKALEAVGGQSATLQSLGGYPNSHPAGETFFTQVPLRHGDHIAKLQLAPVSANLRALADAEVTIGGRQNALREEMIETFAREGGTWELRAQLCTDLETMPIEDASVVWPQEESPYVPVARLTVAPQSAWDESREREVDNRLSFSPWHGLEAHRPLGGVMRARRPVYEAASGYRAALNGCPLHEPREAPALA